MMLFHKKISSDFFLLVLLAVRLRLDSEILLHERYVRAPESRTVLLGSTSAYTQITIRSASSLQFPHPKSAVFNELDEAEILFNRLNYYNSVRERRSNLIAYYANSPDSQNAEAAVESSSAVANGENTMPPGEPSLPMSEASLDSSRIASSEDTTLNSLINELTPEDMDLIEILWKQDIDLGVSKDAYDSRTNLEAEKLKEAEFTKEIPQDFYVPDGLKSIDEIKVEEEVIPAGNYTVDSETGEFILEEFSELCKQELSEAQYFDNETFQALNQDSYLPFTEDNRDISNLTDVFGPGEFPELMPENYTDSEFILSTIDIEKELVSYIEERNEGMYSQPVDMFPTVDDCWPDSTTAMLPLLSIGSTQPSTFTSLSPRSEPFYQTSHSIHPFTTSLINRSSEEFTSILHHSTALEASSPEETFHPIIAPIISGPSSVACALAESIATLHNDSDPLPSSSLTNADYMPDHPEMVYSNQSLTNSHNDQLLIHNLFTEEDFQLVSMPSEINSRNHNGDHVDSSNDSTSLASGRVPSASDCPDWVDSCSESSSHHGENRSYTVTPHMRENLIRQNTEFYATLPNKRQKHSEHEDCDEQELNGANFGHPSANGHVTIKSEYPDTYEIHSGFADYPEPEPAYKKFDYSNVRQSDVAFRGILQHNHSYHLPFSSNDSRYKPVLRDKCKSSSEEEANNKDEKKAKELNLPISIDDIINLAIEEYNERLAKYELTDQQLNLIRDIRRRGKNKVAAQNCRKRKMDQINSLQQDLDAMQSEKNQLKITQGHLLQEKHHIEDKYAQLYQIVSQFTNSKPTGAGNELPIHNNAMTFPTVSDLFSDDDSDLNRGAKTKRKFKK